jgi:hypothetical protein
MGRKRSQTIYDLYKCKNLRNRKSAAFESQHDLIDQYQIQELFLEGRSRLCLEGV